MTFSTNAMSAASGAADVSPATTAARYDLVSSIRQSRLQAAAGAALLLDADGASAAGSPPPHATIIKVSSTVTPLVIRDLMCASPRLQRFSLGSTLVRARMALWISFQRALVRPARTGSRLR